jgi:hypothetical protein
VDRADAGQLTREKIFNPKGWILLHFLLDLRTGLDRFWNFNVSDPELMRMLTRLLPPPHRPRGHGAL